MIDKAWAVSAARTALVVAVACAIPVLAPSAQVEQKPPMYTYVSKWTIPRAQWPELEKMLADTNKVLAGGGSLVGYGSNETLLHQSGGSTHTVWWSAMTMGALLNVLAELHKTSEPVLNVATNHWDGIYVSRFYHWRPGSAHGVYTQTTSYKLKADASRDAVDILSENIFVPLFEKLISDGTLIGYEVYVQAEHTEAPGSFGITFITAKAEGLDKANASIEDAFRANPLIGPAFDSEVDFAAHRDYLSRTEATYR